MTCPHCIRLQRVCSLYCYVAALAEMNQRAQNNDMTKPSGLPLAKLPCADCGKLISEHDDSCPDRECNRYRRPMAAEGLLRAVEKARKQP
jgi:hypothetical protein